MARFASIATFWLSLLVNVPAALAADDPNAYATSDSPIAVDVSGKTIEWTTLPPEMS